MTSLGLDKYGTQHNQSLVLSRFICFTVCCHVLTFFYIETKHSVAIVTGQRVPKMIEKESSKLKFSRKSLFLLLACHGWILFQNQKHLMAESQYG